MTAAELQTLQEMMKQGAGPDFNDDAAQVREDFNGLLASLPVDEDLHFEERSINGVPGTWMEGPSDSRGAVLYLHGGAYVAGTAYGYRSLAGGLARRAKAALFSVEYRLAPEHRFPGALDDALAAYRGLLDSGYLAHQVAVAGDSAGGGLAAALLLAIKDAGLDQPAAAWLLSPWVDLAIEGETAVTKADEDGLLDQSGLRKSAGDYLGDQDPRNPLASPVNGDLSGLAPMMITVGSAEILLDDAIRLAARAGAAGTNVRLDIGASMFHVFPLFAAMLSEGRDGLDAAGAFLTENLDRANAAVTVGK